MMFGQLKNIHDDKGDVIEGFAAADRQLCSSRGLKSEVVSSYSLGA